MIKKINNQFQFDGLFGLEKENIRIKKDGTLSNRKHGDFFSSTNSYISRDFAEVQLEMITKPHSSIRKVYDELHNIQHVVLSSIQDELLWPQSNPPILPNDDEIYIASMGEEELKYREYLASKYGKPRSLFTGIHFNFSFSEEDLKCRFIHSGKLDYYEFKNQLYLKVLKYFIRDTYIYVKLFAASPVFHETFLSSCRELANKTNLGDYSSESLLSLRNSECGYKNQDILTIDYSNIDNYKLSINNMIEQEILKSEKEIYEPVRLKFDKSGNIEYLEIRFIDINPMFFNGVVITDLELIHLAAIYYSNLDDIDFSNDKRKESEMNLMALNSVDSSKDIVKQKHILSKKASTIIEKMSIYFSLLPEVPYDFNNVFTKAKYTLSNDEETYSFQIKDKIEKESFIEYHINIANKQKEYVLENPLSLLGYEKLELSTIILIKSAIKMGYEYKVLDEKENFIELISPVNRKTEYIKQATKTRLDNYSSVLMMENKLVTKNVLNKSDIPTPLGYSVNSKVEALKLYEKKVLPNYIVIKPNTTNFGYGITIFKNGYNYKEYESAIDHALSFDDTIIIEEYKSGKEYRFLIIGGKVQGILFRKPANVIGDGIHSIKELVEEKNKNPLRGQGYTKPLEVIKIDNVVVNYLKEQNLSIDSILDNGEEVFLRNNSNISTGGDSIDMSNQVHQDYIDIAEKAAKALNVNITGVDMIIEDINMTANPSNHSIIELNFNPAIHIHCYPLIGQRNQIGDILIEEIFKNK